MEGFTNALTGEAQRGFIDIMQGWNDVFPPPDPVAIAKELDKKPLKLFGEYLRLENVLQNYDEFASLKDLQNIDMNNQQAVEEFKAKYCLNDEAPDALQTIHLPSERKIQDYRSTYNDIREWIHREKSADETDKSTIN